MTDENKLITDNRVTSPVQNDQAKQHYIQRDDKLYLRVTLSFFMVGLATFALLYFVQPILPLLSDDFRYHRRRPVCPFLWRPDSWPSGC